MQVQMQLRVERIGKRHARAIACEHCYVEMRPRLRQQTDADFAAFWNRCSHPARAPHNGALCDALCKVQADGGMVVVRDRMTPRRAWLGQGR